ncbi:MAG: nitroreductase family deazaflavin-dependent oxidoreductase [Candidatus Helarchaeota archaeon]
MPDSNLEKEHDQEFPRPGSAIYNMIKSNPEERKKTLKKWKRMNKYLTIPFYRIRLLPLFGFGRVFLLLTTIGRKSGKIRRTPLEYHRIDGKIHIFSGRGEEADWLKNLRANPDKVHVRYGFHSFKPKIEIIEDNKEKEKVLHWYVTKHPKAAKMLFGWDPKRDDPGQVDLSSLEDIITIIKLQEPSTEQES